MIIEINDTWRIESDNMNYSLCQRVTVKNGKHAGEEAWPVEGYYSSPASCLYALVKREVATSEQIVDIKGFVRLYKQVAETFAARIPAKQAEEIIQKLDRIEEPERPTVPETPVAKAKPKRAPAKSVDD